MADWEDPPSITPTLRRLWIHGFVAGLAVVLILFLAWFFFFKGEPTPSMPETDAKDAAAQAPPSQPAREPVNAAASKEAPAASGAEMEALVRHQLEETLGQVREANLKKNLSLFLDNYALTDPQREKKRRETVKSWQTYDYLNLAFTLGEVKILGPESAFARVTWEMRTRHRRSKEIKVSSRTYDVWFAKSSGKWRIRTLEKAG